MPQSHQPVPVHRRVQKKQKTKFNPKPSKGQTKEAMIKEWNDMFFSVWYPFGLLVQHSTAASTSNTSTLKTSNSNASIRRGCTRRWFQKKHAMTTTSVGDHRVIWVIWVIDAEVIKSDKVGETWKTHVLNLSIYYPLLHKLALRNICWKRQSYSCICNKKSSIILDCMLRLHHLP